MGLRWQMVMPCHGSNYALNILSLSDMHHFRWQPHLEVNCSSLFCLCVCVCVLELTSYLALCEMYWPRFCPRDHRGLLVFHICFVILIFRKQSQKRSLHLPILHSCWHSSILPSTSVSPSTDTSWIKEFQSQIMEESVSRAKEVRKS